MRAITICVENFHTAAISLKFHLKQSQETESHGGDCLFCLYALTQRVGGVCAVWYSFVMARTGYSPDGSQRTSIGRTIHQKGNLGETLWLSSQISFFVFIHMDIALGIWNTDPLGIKLLLNLFRGIKVKSPVVIGRCPCPGDKIDATVGQL